MSNPNLNFTHSKCRLRRIKQVQFGVLSPEGIRKGSVTQRIRLEGSNEEVEAGITLFERFRNGKAVYGGIEDPRMGTFDFDNRCKTCDCTYAGSGSKIDDCPGHFGHIDLVRPVYHCGFIDDITKILRCVCYHCSRLLIDDMDPKDKPALAVKDPETRLRKMHERCKAKHKCTMGDISNMTSFLDNLNQGGGGANAASGAIDDVTQTMQAMDVVTGNVSGISGADGASVLQNADGSTTVISSEMRGCGAMVPRYQRRGMQIEIEYPEDMEQIPGTGDRRGQFLSAEKAYQILKGVTDKDCERLGLNPKYCRPEWMLVSVLPVPPPHVRPSVMQGAQASSDDLTHILTNIVKANEKLKDCIRKGDPPHILQDFELLLQTRVTCFFDNARTDTAAETQRTGRPLKSLRQRIVGKEGRLRGNLMGKRVDFSARTVITADPNLSIDQVGVPRTVALRLTVPTPVTPFNIHELKALISNGPLNHPGAMYVIRSDNSRIDLRYVRDLEDFPLELGWTVERHLRDDDVVLFNRQPSLHKMSIMGHRAKILDWSTFRLNLSVTTPYNADFDGDEMNLHVPQSMTARADAEQIMMVPRNIVTPQSNRNVMGIVQDALLGVCRITKRDVYIEKDVMMNSVLWLGREWDGTLPTPAIVKPRPLWTGKQLVSMVLPDINYKGKSKSHPRDGTIFNHTDSEVLIHSGMLMSGIVDKNIVGTSAGSIVHVCWLSKGWEETRAFMNQCQTAVNYWMAQTSYTVSISDTVADNKTMESIQDTLDTAKKQVKDIFHRGIMGKIEKQPGKHLMESFEVNIGMVLRNVRDVAGTYAVDSLSQRNAIKGTVMSGSKGNNNNISQIIACVGQQEVGGGRIAYGFNHRTLPHFHKDNLGPEARGFVENSYLRGLTPAEFFFHGMGGRVGLIDTAVKTSETGYIQRRLVKAMETVMARYDGTVRNSRGSIMQFLYGEDGMDAQRIERQYFDTYSYNHPKFRDAYFLDIDDEKFGQLSYIDQKTNRPAMFIRPDDIDKLRSDEELQQMLEAEFQQLQEDRIELRKIMRCKGPGAESDNMAYLPVNIDRLVFSAQRNFNVNELMPTLVSPKYLVEKLKSTLEELMVVRGEDPLSKQAQYNCTLLFKIFVRSKLASKRVMRDLRLSEEAFNWVCDNIISDFRGALIAPGETVGVLAAQSIGEPATQMTLNTFHSSGISTKNVTQGVPRLNEILNIAKNLKTPGVIINLKVRNDEKVATSLISLLEYTSLGTLATKTEIRYDPNPTETVVEEDKELIENFFDVEVDENVDAMSPWVLRLVLNETAVNLKGLVLSDIASKITEFFMGGVHVVYPDNNTESGYVLRIRIINSNGASNAGGYVAEGEGEEATIGNDDFEVLRRMERTLLDSLHLIGVPGIKKVYISKKTQQRWDAESALGGFIPHDDWELETDGTNLAEILTYPDVDHTATQSNDIMEMFNVLGIEGGRSALFNELRGVLSTDNSYVNYRHIALLSDCMTFGGYLMAVSRHGVNRSDAGPMLRASFEETVEVFMNAATFSQNDMLTGVTENVMLGQLAHVGTGMVDLLVDTTKLSAAIPYDLSNITGQQSSAAAYGISSEDATPFANNGSATPAGFSGFDSMTPLLGGFTPGGQTPGFGKSPMYGASPYYSGQASPAAGGFGAASPSYSPSANRGLATQGLSPAYSGTSGTSPAYSATSPAYSPTSPAYSPTSPAYSPTSPAYSPNHQASPAYSPTSPSYSPTSPSMSPGGGANAYGQSPQYSPTSPAYSPTSPAYSPTSPAYSPTSPAYSPTSPAYSPTSPAYSPTSPAYSPTSPAYSPTSPAYSPSSPAASLGAGSTSGTSGTAYSPSSPAYSPTSPAYSPANTGEKKE